MTTLRSIYQAPSGPIHVLLVAACCALPAQAANEETITAARNCAEMEWADKGGYERAEAYRAAVDCLGALYIRVAAGARTNQALEQGITKHLRELEAAFHASRNVCRLQEQLGLEDQGCGTGSASPHEFMQILKTMILNADAGRVRRDPALAEALNLE